MRETKNHGYRALLPFVAALAVTVLTSGAEAQVTSAQQSAIKASCRSDFMSKCSGVTPGGKDALVCLQKNVDNLSAACKSAVSATLPPPAPAAAKPVEAAPPKAVAAPAPAVPAVVSAPPPKAKVTTPPRAVANPAAAKPAAVGAAPAARPAPAVAAPAVAVAPAARPPKAPLVNAAMMLRACKLDLIRHCRGVSPGSGRELACLAAHKSGLTIRCKTAMKVTSPLR